MLSYCSNLINDYLEILIRHDIFKWSLSEVISSIENVSKFVAVVIDIVYIRIIAVGNGKTLNAEALLAVAELDGHMPVLIGHLRCHQAAYRKKTEICKCIFPDPEVIALELECLVIDKPLSRYCLAELPVARTRNSIYLL